MMRLPRGSGALTAIELQPDRVGASRPGLLVDGDRWRVEDRPHSDALDGVAAARRNEVFVGEQGNGPVRGGGLAITWNGLRARTRLRGDGPGTAAQAQMRA